MSGEPPRLGAVRWTVRAYLFFGFGAGLTLVALVAGSPAPLFLALPLLIAPFGAAWSIPRRLESVDLDWEAVGPGAEIEVEGRVTGKFGAAAADVTVDIELPPGIVRTEGVGYERDPLAIRFRSRWSATEPIVTVVPPPVVRWRDALGLSERVLGGRRPALALERYPSGLKGLSSIRLDRTLGVPGETRSRFVGSSGEFFGLRRPMPGEPYRRINWKATARSGYLLANDYEVERAGDLIILLDLRPSALGPDHDERLLGLARAAAFGIADSLLRSKVRLGFATFGEFVQAVPLSTGRVHRLRIEQAILSSRLAESSGPAARCAIGLSRFYPPGTTTLVLSSAAGDSDSDLIPTIRRTGFPVVMLSPSPLPMREGWGGLHPADEQLAAEIERLERRDRLAPLWGFGPVIDWADYWSLSNLVRYLRRPSRRRSS